MSLLRQLLADDPAFAKAESELTPEQARERHAAQVGALLAAATIVHWSGLEHLVTEASPSEALAMAKAGELVARRRALLLAEAIRDHAKALEPFDGGEALIDQVLDEALDRAEGKRPCR